VVSACNVDGQRAFQNAVLLIELRLIGVVHAGDGRRDLLFRECVIHVAARVSVMRRQAKLEPGSCLKKLDEG